jgi:hypothetical protein
VVATFRYDEQEIEQIEADLGPGALHSPDFTVTIGYRDRSKLFSHRYNETAIVKHLHCGLDLPSAAAATVNATSTVAELLNAIDRLEDQHPQRPRLPSGSGIGAIRTSGTT